MSEHVGNQPGSGGSEVSHRRRRATKSVLWPPFLPSCMYLRRRRRGGPKYFFLSSAAASAAPRVRPKPISAEIFSRIPNRIFCRNRIHTF